MFILTVLSICDSPAQNRKLHNKSNPGCTLSVIVTDSVTNDPVELASVLILKDQDSSMVTGAATDSMGTAKIEISQGSYFAIISFLGYHQHNVSSIVITENMNDFNLGSVQLSPKSISLKPVHVTAEKERIIYEDDKIIYNVEKDIMNLGGSALEVLDNAPLIKVSYDGKIKMLGRKSVAVFIDGIAVKNMGTTKEVLQTIPYTDIEKIEIIMNPGIEFGADITGGVVNIILKKDSDTKYNGSVTAIGNTNNNYSGAASFSYKLEKGKVGGRIYSSYSNRDHNSWLNRQTSFNDDMVILNQSKKNKNEMLNKSLNLNYNFRPNDENMLTQSLSYSPMNSDVKTILENNYTNEKNSSVDWNRSAIYNKINSSSLYYSINYLRSFKTKGKKFTLSGSYRNMLSNTEGNQLKEYDKAGNDKTRQDNYLANKNVSLNVKAGYTHPFDEENSLSINYDMSISLLKQQYNYWNLEETGYVENITNKNNQKYNEQNHSVGVSFSGKIFDFKYRVSGWVYKLIKNYEEEVNNESYNYKCWSAGPQISISRKINKNNNINAFWRRNEFPPQDYQLSANNDYSDSSSISFGNTRLTPTKYETFRVDYLYHYLLTSISSGIAYDRYWNGIQSYTYMVNEKTSVTSYRNIGKAYSYEFYLGADQILFDIWTISLSGSVDKKYVYNSAIDYDDLTWHGNIETGFKFGDFGIQAKLQYVPASTSSQTVQKEYHYLDIWAKAIIIDKRLFVSFGVNDLLNSIKNNLNRTGTGFISSGGENTITRTVSLNISYYFQDTEKPEDGGDGSAGMQN